MKHAQASLSLHVQCKYRISSVPLQWVHSLTLRVPRETRPSQLHHGWRYAVRAVICCGVTTVYSVVTVLCSVNKVILTAVRQ